MDSLRDEALAEPESQPVLKTFPAPAYEPETDAYAVDDAQNPYRQFYESVQSGARVTLQLACADGRREQIALNEADSKRWVECELEDRIAFANGKIYERRRQTARSALAALRERGATIAQLTPDEEACLREFGLIEDVQMPLPDGGYAQSPALRESKLREDGFWDGGFDGAEGSSYTAPTQREYLPQGGPQGQQQMISDVWQAQAKCYWAWTHDPLARAACELVADFVLGRGVSVIANDQRVQLVIDEFLARDGFQERLHEIAVSLSRDGELFLRFFPLGDGRTKVRSLPPETIWEIVTDAEDPLTVYWYVQRYNTRYVLFAPPGLEAAQMRWIDRMIPAAEVVHIKINAKESDVRGRSDMFPALGWMKRMRDYFDAIIQKEYANAAYQWWYQINGGAADIARIASTVIPTERPMPGSYFLSNDQVKIQAVNSQIRAVGGQYSAYDALLNHISLPFGLNKTYFGADTHTNRASALVATEPTAKHLENRQEIIGYAYRCVIDRVIGEARKHALPILNGVTDWGFKTSFPSIIKADAAARAQMIRQGEASAYFSKKTAAEYFAGEAEIEDYDFDTEMQGIQAELGQDPRKLIAHDMAQVAKGTPQRGDIAFNPGEVPDPDLAPKPAPTPAQASPTSAVGAAKIRNEQGPGGVNDRSTMESDEAFHEAARARGAVVIIP